MASYDLKAILGEKLKRLTEKTLKALVDCMCTVGASLCSLNERVSALESVELPEGGYKPMQEPVASPSASGTAIQFIEFVSQDATGRMTATKKTVRTGSTSQTGVLQLTDSHSSTSTTTAATPKNVKEAYDLANGKQSPATTIAGYGITDAYTKTEVDTFLAVKAEQVNVTNYTSFSDIGAVVSAGNIPYYYHAVGSGAAKLYYQGTSVSGGIPPTVSQVFAGVFNGVLYETRFVNGASAFSAVVETPIFSAERVASSGESSSWSSDDTNVPTRAAVESKISSAMSGNIGGFLGSWTPIGVQYYQTANDFKKGDWVSITEAGSVAYYKNNDRSQSYTTFAVNAGDDIYWTTSGEFQKKASTALQIYPISNLEDWNSLTNTGLYQIASQASDVAHGPGSGSGGRIACYVAVTNGRIIQLAIAGHLWRRQSDNNGGFSNASWEEIAFSSQVYSYVAKTGTYSESSNPFALKDYVDALSTNIPKSRLDQNVQNSLTRADNALTGDPLGITNGSGVTSAYRGAIVFILFTNSDFVVHGSGGPVISGATVGGKLCINPKWLVEYKINLGDRKNHQMYAVLNASGSDFVLTKGIDSSSASAADHILVKNEKIEFFGCYGGSSTLQNSDYYLVNY
jgi:hypothetical protein